MQRISSYRWWKDCVDNFGLIVNDSWIKDGSVYFSVLLHFYCAEAHPEPEWAPSLNRVWGPVTYTGMWQSWIRHLTGSVYTELSSLHFSPLLTSSCSVSLCSSCVWSHPSLLIHSLGINPCVITWRGSMWSQVGGVLDAPGLSSKWYQERMG